MGFFGNRKIKGPIEVNMGKGVFCNSWSAYAKDCAHDLVVLADGKFYNLIYRDSRFQGMADSLGGPVYPFSEELSKPSSRADKKKHTKIEIVCIVAGQVLDVKWGVSDKYLYDAKDKKDYSFNAYGQFFVEIDRADAAGNADKFYQKLCVENGTSVMTNDELRDKLRAAFENRIAAVIEKVLLDMDRSLSSFVNVMASEALEINKKIYKEVKNLFSSFGITIVEEASLGSIVERVGVKELIK